jgi:hypothetical protein
MNTRFWVEPVFRENFSQKMALFFAERNAAKNGTFSRSEKWRKIVLFAVQNAAKMVQFWAVSWVEPVFRDFFREKWHFFCAERNAAKNGAFQKKFERKKIWRFIVGENGEK